MHALKSAESELGKPRIGFVPESYKVGYAKHTMQNPAPDSRKKNKSDCALSNLNRSFLLLNSVHLFIQQGTFDSKQHQLVSIYFCLPSMTACDM